MTSASLSVCAARRQGTPERAAAAMQVPYLFVEPLPGDAAPARRRQ
jgi:hypothetical protein